MKRRTSVFLTCLLGALVWLPACGGGGGGTPTTPTSSAYQRTSKNLSVVLPEGALLDPAQTTIRVLGEDYPLEDSGSITVDILEEGYTLVYLFDGNGDIVMMGFVSADDPSLEVADTLVAALCFAFGTIFEPNEIKEAVLASLPELPEVQAAIDALTQMYLSGTPVLDSEEFLSLVGTVVDDLLNSQQPINEKSVINTEGSVAKSGIRVLQDASAFDQCGVVIHNEWRRRAKAFFYKTHVKTKGSSEFTELVDPESIGADNLAAEADYSISAVAGVTSVQGSLIGLASDQGQSLGFTRNGPVTFVLSDDELATKYTVRVVGPGSNVGKFLGAMTEAENDALLFLKVQTLLSDFIVPIVAAGVGAADIVDFKSSFDIGAGIECATSIFASIPAAVDAANNGDYYSAAVEFLKAIAANVSGTEKFIGLFEAPFKKLRVDLDDFAGRVAAPLTVANGVLTVVDFGRISLDLGAAYELEKFEIIVSRGTVKVNPPLVGVSKGNRVYLEASVLEDESIEQGEYTYKWSSTGSVGQFYGETSERLVSYGSDSEAEISEAVTEEVTVEVYNKDGSLLGEATSEVTITPTEYQITPDGVTMKGDSQIRLRIVDPQKQALVNVEPTELNPVLGRFKVVWETAGEHGNLMGFTNSLTTEDDFSVVYHCTDSDTAGGEETITAKIYFADFFSDGSLDAYRHIETTEATINIENDDKKLYFYVPTEVKERPVEQSGIWYNYGAWSAWRFDPARAQPPEGLVVDRISMKVLEYFPDVRPSCTSTSKTFYPANAETDLVDGKYEITCNYSGGSTPFADGAAAGFANVVAAKSGKKGYAQVTVYLKAEGE